MPKLLTGQFFHADGSQVSNGFLYLKLSQDATASGTGQVAPRTITVNLNSTGQVPPSTTIYGNDELSPAGTFYTISVDDAGRGNIYGPEMFVLSGSSPINLNNLTPVATSPPIVIENQNVNTGLFNRLDAGLGTPLSSSDFVLTGWGSGASIVSIVGSDSAFSITIQAGTSPSQSPTAVLTWHDGNWPQKPISVSEMTGGTGQVSDISNAPSFSTLTLTYDGLPVASSSYTIQVFTIGSGVGSGGGNPNFDTTVRNLTVTQSLILQQLITEYNNINTVSNGVPAEYATVDLTTQSAAISPTTLYTPTATGMFRISGTLKITTTGTNPNVGPVTISYTDGTDSVAQSINMGFISYNGTPTTTTNSNSTTTGTLAGIPMTIYAKTGVAIQYAVAVSGAFGSGKYSLHLKLEAL